MFEVEIEIDSDLRYHLSDFTDKNDVFLSLSCRFAEKN
jgi:hypothetical protein